MICSAYFQPLRKSLSSHFRLGFFSLAFLTFGLGACKKMGTVIPGSKPLEAWNEANNPVALLPNNTKLERRFGKLKMRGEVSSERKPWIDFYWPNYKGSTAFRWNSPAGPDFKSYPLHSKEQVMKMSLKQRLTLSPAEKYSILIGDWDYQLVKFERNPAQGFNPIDQEWYGLCDGIAQAAVNFKEPRPVIVKSAEGIEIPFGASDIKALLAKYMAMFAPEASGRRYLGGKCQAKDDSTEGATAFALSECKDVNPGSFHLILANYIGELKKPFVGDLVNGEQVWNYPIYAYQSFELAQQGPTPGKAAKGTVREIKLQTDVSLKYVVDTPSLQNYNDSGQRTTGDFKTMYHYTLELNDKDEIIGGEWNTENIPDFLWLQPTPAKFDGFFSKLGELYETSLKSDPSMDLTKLP